MGTHLLELPVLKGFSLGLGNSGSGYPGSSPGLPAKISTIKLGCSGLVVARACDFAFRWRAVV